MATLIELDARGHLHKIDPGLPSRIQEDRVIYASPDLRTWLENDLHQLGSSWNIEMSPAEQLAAWIEVYASGDRLVFGQNISPLRPLGNGVWELKTADLRVFGWFHQMDHFVAHRAGSAERIKEFNLYHGMAGEVVRFRDQLDLDEPKFIAGGEPHAVISNFSFP